MPIGSLTSILFVDVIVSISFGNFIFKGFFFGSGRIVNNDHRAGCLATGKSGNQPEN